VERERERERVREASFSQPHLIALHPHTPHPTPNTQHSTHLNTSHATHLVQEGQGARRFHCFLLLRRRSASGWSPSDGPGSCMRFVHGSCMRRLIRTYFSVITQLLCGHRRNRHASSSSTSPVTRSSIPPPHPPCPPPRIPLFPPLLLPLPLPPLPLTCTDIYTPPSPLRQGGGTEGDE
jgi:hypothetical protein